MARKIHTGVGSVSGVKAAEKNAPADSTIRSAPEDHAVPERDSGDAADPSVTGPVDGDGNVVESEDQSNMTVASDNPTNAEVAEAKETADDVATTDQLDHGLLGGLLDGADQQEQVAGDPGDNLDDDLPDLSDGDLDPVDEDVELTEEEIANAAQELNDEAKLAAEQQAQTTNEDEVLAAEGLRDEEIDQTAGKPDGDALQVSKRNPQDDDDAGDDDAVGEEGRDNFNLDQGDATGAVSKMAVGNDGQITDLSDELADDQDNDGDLAPAHNGSGHRNTFINSRGNITVMDDETAARFYEDPKFYEYTYDTGDGTNKHVSFLRWADAHGNPVGGTVGDKYELDQ